MLKIIRRRDGSTILEFAVVFPIFIALLLGTINFALLLNNQLVAQDAAREMANTAAVTGNNQKALKKGKEIFDIGGIGGTAQFSVGSPGVGIRRINATVTYTTPITAPGIGSLLGNKPWDKEITLQEQTSYYVEYPLRSGYTKPHPIYVGGR